MDAQQFLTEFRHIANAPDGILRIRELVLVLAMQGKLVPQLPGATAAELLTGVTEEKRRLIDTGVILPPKPLPPLGGRDVPHAIPENWVWVRFGEIARHNSGKTLDSVRNSGIPRDYLTTSNVYWGRFDLGGVRQMLIREEELEKCTARKNDLLICEGGEAGRAAVWTSESEVCFQNHIHRARFFGGVNPFYAYRLFEKLNATGEINAHRKGIGISNLSSKALAMIPFPLPPLEEQVRIVTRIDELMAVCDRLETQQQARRRLQNWLRQSVLAAVGTATNPYELQAAWNRLEGHFGHLFSAPEDVTALRSMCVELAIRGELTTRGGTDQGESIETLVASLRESKRGRRIARTDEAHEPFPLPRNWAWVEFDDLLADSESGWSPKCDSEPRRPGEWGVLKVSAVTWGEFRPGENKRLPPSLEPRAECEAKPGDFLLSRANTAELVARSVVVPESCPERLLLSDKIVRLNFVDPSLKAWANLVNNSGYARDYYRANATGTSDSMRNVSRQVIHELPLPLAPREVQRSILRKVGQLHAWCDELESGLRHARELAARLAAASIAIFTGVDAVQHEGSLVKPPPTELIAPLRLGQLPDARSRAPLATILARHDGEMSAGELWQRFGGEIDAFYAQLKTEVGCRWIMEPEPAEVREMPVAAEVA